MVTVNNILRANPFLAGFDGDWHAMLIRTADKYHLFAFEAQVANIDIGRNIYTGKVSDVHWTIGVGQGRSYSCTFESHFNAFVLLNMLFFFGLQRYREFIKN